MKYKGDSVVYQGESRERNEHGQWVSVFRYVGLVDSIRSSAMAQGVGNRITVEQNAGPMASMTLSIGNLNDAGQEQITERWEADSETVDKDILYSQFVAGLSEDGLEDVKKFRQSPGEYKIGIPLAALALFPAVIDPKTSSIVIPGYYYQIDDPKKKHVLVGDGSESDTTIMAQVSILVLRGTESFQITTPTLKRTRTMSATMASPLIPSAKPTVYSTAYILAQENPLADIQPYIQALNGDPYDAPRGCAWGWMKRLDNRSFTGNGLVEEQTQWVYAAWSTALYFLQEP